MYSDSVVHARSDTGKASPELVERELGKVPLPIGHEAFESVLTAAKAGAEWAWASIYRDLAGPVRGYLASRGAHEPDDVTSEVFLRVASAIQRFEGDEPSFRSWVFVIAHRRLIDERRSRGRRPDLIEWKTETIPRGGVGDVESEAMDRLSTEQLHETFSVLTDAQREVLALRVIGGLSLQQTADVMGKRVGAVKALQHRALAALHARFESEGISR